MTSFFSLGAKSRLKDDNKLLKILNLINWQKIETKLLGINKNKIDGKTAGIMPYHPLSMFKAILLQSWHSLSDKELEDALNVRIDFMIFCNFDLADTIPDQTTICRFRNKLTKKDLDQLLFTEVNNQLENLGLKVKKADMAIVDATIIESAARPRMKILEEIAEDRREDESANNFSNYNQELSSDPDAKWLKKGNKYYFGYKAFTTVDDEGFISKTHTVPANEAEVNKLEIMFKGVDTSKFAGDKIYGSKNNRKILRASKIKTRLMYKASKHKSLTNRQKKFNKAVSKLRFRVEQSFGILKRRFGFNRSSYFSTRKTHAQFTIKAICLNLLKAVNKITDIIRQPQLLTG